MSYHSRNSRDSVLGVYVVGVGLSAAYCAYKIFRAAYDHRAGAIRNGMLSGASAVAGAAMGLAWPIVAPGILTWELMEAARNLQDNDPIANNGRVVINNDCVRPCQSFPLYPQQDRGRCCLQRNLVPQQPLPCQVSFQPPISAQPGAPSPARSSISVQPPTQVRSVVEPIELQSPVDVRLRGVDDF